MLLLGGITWQNLSANHYARNQANLRSSVHSFSRAPTFCIFLVWREIFLSSTTPQAMSVSDIKWSCMNLNCDLIQVLLPAAKDEWLRDIKKTWTDIINTAGWSIGGSLVSNYFLNWTSLFEHHVFSSRLLPISHSYLLLYRKCFLIPVLALAPSVTRELADPLLTIIYLNPSVIPILSPLIHLSINIW